MVISDLGGSDLSWMILALWFRVWSKFVFKFLLFCNPLLCEWFTCSAWKVWNHFKIEQLKHIRNEWELAELFLKTHLYSLKMLPLPPDLGRRSPSYHHSPCQFFQQKPGEGGSHHTPYMCSLRSSWPWCVFFNMSNTNGMWRLGEGWLHVAGRMFGTRLHVCCLPVYPRQHRIHCPQPHRSRVL